MDKPNPMALGPVDATVLDALRARARTLLNEIRGIESLPAERTMQHHRSSASAWAQFHSVMAALAASLGLDASRHERMHGEYLKQVARLVNAEKQDLMPDIVRNFASLEGSDDKLRAIP